MIPIACVVSSQEHGSFATMLELDADRTNLEGRDIWCTKEELLDKSKICLLNRDLGDQVKKVVSHVKEALKQKWADINMAWKRWGAPPEQLDIKEEGMETHQLKAKLDDQFAKLRKMGYAVAKNLRDWLRCLNPNDPKCPSRAAKVTRAKVVHGKSFLQMMLNVRDRDSERLPVLESLKNRWPLVTIKGRTLLGIPFCVKASTPEKEASLLALATSGMVILQEAMRNAKKELRVGFTKVYSAKLQFHPVVLLVSSLFLLLPSLRSHVMPLATRSLIVELV